MIIDCIADLHGFFPKLEGGDLLIVAGDLTARDTEDEYYDFIYWLSEQDYKEKILIAGNHDTFLVKKEKWFNDELEKISKSLYLCDSGTEFEYEVQIDHPASNEHVSIDVLMSETRKLKIWGSPWTKTFENMNPKCKAFTCETEEELADKWALIPDDIDILITHSPIWGVLDRIDKWNDELEEYEHVGSKSLQERFKNLKYRPIIHICGHIHEGYGYIKRTEYNLTHFINCSHVNEHYEPVNKPVRIIL